MSTDINDLEAVEKRLWAEIDKLHTGMLGLVDGEPQHFQPMTAFAEPETRLLWFFTRTDTDLARDAAAGRHAMFVLQAKDQELQACIGGELKVQVDRQRLEKLWNAHVAAWYPQGKDDPHLTMLCLTCEDARVWISQGGPVKYFWEVAKANSTGSLPDVGGSTDVPLN